MHRDVGIAAQHRILHFLHEDPGPTDRVDRTRAIPVSLGRHDHELDCATESRRHSLRLPSCQRTPARGDADRGDHSSGSRMSKSDANASEYSSPRADPAASFSRTVGSWSSLFTMP